MRSAVRVFIGIVPEPVAWAVIRAVAVGLRLGLHETEVADSPLSWMELSGAAARALAQGGSFLPWPGGLRQLAGSCPRRATPRWRVYWLLLRGKSLFRRGDGGESMRLPDGQAHAPPLELLVPIAGSAPASLGDVLCFARQPVAGPCASAIRTKAGRSVTTMRPVT